MKKTGLILLACVVVLWSLAACCGGSSQRTASKETPVRCRASAFDYYCALRPPNWGHDSRQTAFAPAVFSAMKAQGYKVYLVSYHEALPDPRWAAFASARTPAWGYGQRDFFGDAAYTMVATGFGTGSGIAADNARSGYGFRDFFGDRTTPTNQTAARANGHQNEPAGPVRHVVLWENRPGQFFLVDGPYAEPQWVAGHSWEERVRFHDRHAGTIESVRS